jgi:hypothetical protein
MRKLGIHTKVDHPRVRYTLEFLQQHPLLRRAGLRMVINNAYEENEWNIVYQNSSKPDAADYRIPVQAYFFRPESPAVDWSLHTYRFEGKKVFSVEPDTQPEILPMVQDRLFQFDVLETIFFHISRFEEVFAPPEKHNDSGWLDERHHLLLQHQIQQIPVVDQLVASLLHLLLGKAVRFDTTYARYRFFVSLSPLRGGPACAGRKSVPAGRFIRHGAPLEAVPANKKRSGPGSL